MIDTPRKHQVVAQVYVWMQSYRAQNQKIEDHLDHVFGEIKLAGIHAVEGWLEWFSNPTQRDQIARLLSDHQMQMPGVYYNALIHDSDQLNSTLDELYQLAEHAQQVDCNMIVCNPTPIDWNNPIDKTKAQLATQAEALNQIGAQLQSMGMQLAVHHHDAEMRNQATEFLHILENTNPEQVGICLDFDWILRGGQSPLEMLNRVGTRLTNAHIRNTKSGRWTEAFGEGDIDYTTIQQTFQKIGYQGPLVIELVYEKDILPTNNIGKQLERSRHYLETAFNISS